MKLSAADLLLEIVDKLFNFASSIGLLDSPFKHGEFFSHKRHIGVKTRLLSNAS